MQVLITGAHGRVGTAITDSLSKSNGYTFNLLDKSPHSTRETFVANVANFNSIRPAFEGQDAVIHLAGYPELQADWEPILKSNIIGTYNVVQAAAEAGVEKVIFASSNHAVGMYEAENAPSIYSSEHDLVVDHRAPVRPDTYYGTSKVWGEAIGRYYVENDEYPTQFYALRIGSLRHEKYDHPYGDAEKGVDEGKWERESDEYEEMVARMKAMWQSRRDLAQQAECCLQDDTVDFDVFYGVSDNDARWFDLEHGRSVLGYRPRDNGAEWDGPPA